MTAAQFEAIDETEAEMILRWRFDELVRAGYDVGTALVLASHVEIDLHQATELVRRELSGGHGRPHPSLTSGWRTTQAGAPMRRGSRPESAPQRMR